MKKLFQPFLFSIFFACFLAGSLQEVSAQKSAGDNALALKKNEVWWGGATGYGSKMPMGNENYSFNLTGDASGNQSVPLLISNEGRWLWSDEPFRYSFRNDSLIIDRTHAAVQFGKSGTSVRDAYQATSKKFFPTSL